MTTTSYEPTTEDIQAYNDDCRKQDAEPYKVSYVHPNGEHFGSALIFAKLTKKGDWQIFESSAMAAGLCEAVGRVQTRTLATDFINRYGARFAAHGWQRS